MVKSDIVKTEAELEAIADVMSSEIHGSSKNIVSRYARIVELTAEFMNGYALHRVSVTGHTNREDMDSGLYSFAFIKDLFPHNFREVTVARELNESRFNLQRKNIPLPVAQETHIEALPSKIDIYDAEFGDFTRDHPNTAITRTLSVEQRVVVNSRGGKFIQSVPLFDIFYCSGFSPIPTTRNISVVCNSDDNIRKLPCLIKYLADPTINGRIRNAASFSQAFHELYGISGLKFGSLPEGGIPVSELYDVVILTGVPSHEIFGHHFEEPIRFLGFGESGTFKYDQNLTKKHFVLKDDPHHTIDGFKVRGFTYFDAYGRKRESQVHIQNGKVVGFLGGEYSDSANITKFMNIQGTEFTGHSVQYIDGFFPQPRMSCTVLDGQTEDVDLEGKILIVPHDGSTNSKIKTYQVSASECYIMRDGEPRRVIPLQVTGGINQALASTILLPHWSYQSGLCGKPDPINSREGFAYAPVSQFARNQIWEKQQVYPTDLKDTHIKIL